MKAIEKYINFIGEKFSYLIPVMALLMVVVVISRYFFGIGMTYLQELIMYFHAIVFLGCAGYVFNKDEHVRVDIFYRNASSKYKNSINLALGFIFLLPIALFILFYSLDLIGMSWKIKEISTEAGGLPYVYIQKTLIVLFPLTLLFAFIGFLVNSYGNNPSSTNNYYLWISFIGLPRCLYSWWGFSYLCIDLHSLWCI